MQLNFQEFIGKTRNVVGRISMLNTSFCQALQHCNTSLKYTKLRSWIPRIWNRVWERNLKKMCNKWGRIRLLLITTFIGYASLVVVPCHDLVGPRLQVGGRGVFVLCHVARSEWGHASSAGICRNLRKIITIEYHLRFRRSLYLWFRIDEYYNFPLYFNS